MHLTTAFFTPEELERIAEIKKYYSLRSTVAVLAFLVNQEHKRIRKWKVNE